MHSFSPHGMAGCQCLSCCRRSMRGGVAKVTTLTHGGTKWSALHEAAMHGQVGAVEFLLGLNIADLISTLDDWERTPYALARETLAQKSKDARQPFQDVLDMLAPKYHIATGVMGLAEQPQRIPGDERSHGSASVVWQAVKLCSNVHTIGLT